MQKDTDLDMSAVRGDARGAVAQRDDIREAVRDIVSRALERRPLQRENMQQVVATVLEGAALGAPESEVDSVAALKQAAAGIDDAMAKAAEASRLAIEEAAGRADTFSETDLKQAIDDLADLDKLYLDAIRTLAKSGAKASRAMLDDLAGHVERAGTDTGRLVRASLDDLQAAVARSHRPHLSDIGRTARAGAATIASIGSGILAGLSDSLAPSAQDGDARDKPAPKES
ncbi:DUF6781 family protein [Actibacterium sp. D379-3]